MQEIVSQKTGISVAEIYGVVTFYSFFSLRPKGKYIIGCCLGTACYVKGAQQAFNDVAAVLRLAEAEFGAPADDLTAVVEEYLHKLFERQLPSLAVDDREIYHAEGALQLRTRIKLAQHEVRVGVSLELNDDAHPVAVGFVAEV